MSSNRCEKKVKDFKIVGFYVDDDENCLKAKLSLKKINHYF